MTMESLRMGDPRCAKFLRRVASGKNCERWTLRMDGDAGTVSFENEIEPKVPGDAAETVTITVRAAEGESPLVIGAGAAWMHYGMTAAILLLDGWKFRYGKEDGSESSRRAGVTTRHLYAERNHFVQVSLGVSVLLNGRDIISGPFPSKF